ncbi:PH and SEC7 domain-containing protein isoform X3 [Homalodisca vitripennis]|uniref:PH and SEC7 domain-containing protein isoform X3 n=1 Tax=Homalodisca vitripennis TaxID=197043 RepID=UPI001EEBFB2F|nr:PH and SEC7 domain-containing protein isoform X3 [Homalodisca vitripennis]
MAEELLVVLSRRDPSCGLGFSLLGTPGLPPIIYDIVENSPAAESGKVEAGDVILKVNETDVNRLNTKEIYLKTSSLTVEVYFCYSFCLLVNIIFMFQVEAGDVILKVNETDVNRLNTKEIYLKTSSLTVEVYFCYSFCLLVNIIFMFQVEAGDVILKVNETDVNRLNTKEIYLKTSSLTVEVYFCYSFCLLVNIIFMFQVEAGDVILKVNETDVNRLNTKEIYLKTSSLTVEVYFCYSFCLLVNIIFMFQVEAGDVILKVNETDVNRLNTKEVLKCIRLSEDPIALKLKRDPLIKAKVRHYLSTANPFVDSHSQNNGDSYLPPSRHPLPLEDVTRSNGDGSRETSPQPQPRFEAFVMTGDRVLKLSKTQQGSILPKQRKVDSLRHHNYHNHNNHQRHNSVPTSPIESERHSHQKTSSAGTSPTPSLAVTSAPIPSSSYVVRTSRSEDHLQFNKDSSMSAVSIDIDDDVTSSLNTLLDTRPDSEAEDQRVVWTYNAPMTDSSTPTSGTTTSENPSPHRSLSPQSPTSVSSSVMSSDSGDRKPPNTNLAPTDLSQSEAISNISSPDFQEEDVEILNARDLVMEVSDPSDSDSTLLLSETTAKVRRTSATHNGHHMNNSVQPSNKNDQSMQGDHRIVIQVKGPEKDAGRSQSPRNHNVRLTNQQAVAERMNTRPCIRESELYQSDPLDQTGYQALKDSDEEKLLQLTESAANLAKAVSPPLEDESDIESLHSFHYSPKAVDIPSAVRLAKRLFTLDGFKKSDVSRHLSKNNDFSRAVAEEYLKYFMFEGDSLDVALRKFLKQFSLTGETQERERVLVHFSKRYLDCNPGSFNSQDAVHTLTCAIMLLNTDLHGQIIGRKMTCTEFIDNLSELNDGENFPREVLKSLYQAIKSYPLEWALDEEGEDANSVKAGVGERGEMPSTLSVGGSGSVVATSKGFFDVPSSQPAIEYKKGYVMRKSCVEPNGKKTPLGKRGWKMFYCTLRDLVLYLHKDEHGFRKSQLSDNLHNAIRIHHSLATKATDYTKKQHVFRLETADQAEYLFQTSDSKELQSWIDTINFVCASFSAQPLPGAVGSQKKFQRPLLPCSHTKLNLREQLQDHEDMVHRLEAELEQHRSHVPERGAKSLTLQNFKEKDAYLHHELKRYKTYAYLLKSRISQFPEMESSLVESSIGEAADEDENQSPTNNRKMKKPGKKA